MAQHPVLKITALTLFIGGVIAFVAYRSDYLFAGDSNLQTHAAEGGTIIPNAVDTPPPNTEIMPSSKIMILPKEDKPNQMMGGSKNDKIIRADDMNPPAQTVDSPQPKKTIMYSTKSAYIVEPTDTQKPKQKAMMGGSKSYKIVKPPATEPHQNNAPNQNNNSNKPN